LCSPTLSREGTPAREDQAGCLACCDKDRTVELTTDTTDPVPPSREPNSAHSKVLSCPQLCSWATLLMVTLGHVPMRGEMGSLSTSSLLPKTGEQWVQSCVSRHCVHLRQDHLPPPNPSQLLPINKRLRFRVAGAFVHLQLGKDGGEAGLETHLHHWWHILPFRFNLSQLLVAHAYNPSYLRG
jgi:hypothetical protein